MDKLYRFPTGGATFACDSTSALKQVFGSHPLSPLEADYDLLSLVRDTIHSFAHLSFSPRHVYGHQDNNTPYAQLDHWSQWNVMADSMAKHYLPDPSPGISPRPPSVDFRLHTNRWQLWTSPTQPTARGARSALSSSTITGAPWQPFAPSGFKNAPYPLTLHRILTGRASRQRCTPHLFAAAGGLSSLTQNNAAGVGLTLYQWKESDSAACPQCPHMPETTSHVLRCQGENSQVIWLRSIARLGRTLHKARTDPEITAS